jgi:hypothetical protein
LNPHTATAELQMQGPEPEVGPRELGSSFLIHNFVG